MKTPPNSLVFLRRKVETRLVPLLSTGVMQPRVTIHPVLLSLSPRLSILQSLAASLRHTPLPLHSSPLTLADPLSTLVVLHLLSPPPRGYLDNYFAPLSAPPSLSSFSSSLSGIFLLLSFCLLPGRVVKQYRYFCRLGFIFHSHYFSSFFVY